MRIIANMIFGSELYGTNSPTSDRDYKGVYLPTLKEAVSKQYKDSINTMTKSSYDVKNGTDDVDTEIYSLQRFLELGFLGETVFLDMIHNKHTILTTSPIWEELYEKRAMFYTKNMKAYIGYCRAQAAKYGIKGSRLNDAKYVLDILDKYDENAKLNTIWDEVKETEHVRWITVQNTTNGNEIFLDVCGKCLQGSGKILHAKNTLTKFYEQYGKRALLAASNEGIDWKAISHAFRAGFQLIEIMETGDLKYPLKDAEFLKKVKYGELHYTNDKIGEQLDTLIERCIELSDKSTLPEFVDRDYWYNWLENIYKQENSPL